MVNIVVHTFTICIFALKIYLFEEEEIKFDIFHRGSICWYWIKVNEHKCCRSSLYWFVHWSIMKLYNMLSLLCCICIPVISSVFCRCKYFLHIRTLWNEENHESCLYSREEEIIGSLIFLSHHILNIEYIKSRVCLFLSLSIESWYIGCIIFAYLQQTSLPSLFKRF